MRVIVTGNIGSGKSTVCRLLAAQLPSYACFNVDEAVRGLYDDPEFKAQLQQLFGASDRKTISDMVFADPSRRVVLENASLAFMRPLMAQAMAQSNVLGEFPLLLELPYWAHRADFVLAVGCDDAQQRARVVARDGMAVDKFERVRASQHSTELKACIADAYLDTGCALQELPARVEAVVRQIHERELQARCNHFFGTPAIWRLIAQAYGQPHRAYHGLSHLQALFREFDAVHPAQPHAYAIELAIWFHDFVYETSAAQYGNNEAASVRAMFQSLKTWAPDWLEAGRGKEVFLAGEFILATRKHRIDAPFVRANFERRRAAELFLDLDLSILSAPTPALLAYDQAIALEWGQTPGRESAAFCQGRCDALRSFLERPHLYFSPAYAAREPVARQNLHTLLTHWSARAEKQGNL